MQRSATTSLMIFVLAGMTAINAAATCWMLWARPFFNSDFLAFWSFPRFAASQPIAGLYNAAALTAFQKTLYPGFKSFYPYLYPPTFLLPSDWLKLFPYGMAETIWTLAGLALFVSAARLAFKNRLAWVAMLASPAALLTIVTGETALFTSALLLAGFAWLPSRPALAGIAFGLLTLKPQLGVLIPFALLALDAWPAILTATLTALALIALSCLAFPPSLWALWAHTLPAYQAAYFAAAHALNLNIIVTPAANLVSLGVPPSIAWVVQITCALAIIAAILWAFRRGPYRLAVAALLTGSFLAVPHAYAYDSITLTAAMALLWRPNPPPRLAALFLVVFLAPLLLLTPWRGCFLYAAPEAILFVTILRMIQRKEESSFL